MVGKVGVLQKDSYSGSKERRAFLDEGGVEVGAGFVAGEDGGFAFADRRVTAIPLRSERPFWVSISEAHVTADLDISFLGGRHRSSRTVGFGGVVFEN